MARKSEMKKTCRQYQYHYHCHDGCLIFTGTGAEYQDGTAGFPLPHALQGTAAAGAAMQCGQLLCRPAQGWRDSVWDLCSSKGVC
jgi:hypothetical protein